jgi:hypothetical protein
VKSNSDVVFACVLFVGMIPGMRMNATKSEIMQLRRSELNLKSSYEIYI